MSNAFPLPSPPPVTLAYIAATQSFNADALFSALLPLSFRGVEFPYLRLRTRFREDLAIHKFADRDGAHIEGMGRHPLEFTARIPFLNGLDAGQNETWQRPLYPLVRDNLLRAVLDKSSGPLQHPEFGKTFSCKCQTMEWELEASVRSGVWVDIVWLESDDTGQELEDNLAGPSPLAGVQSAANDLTTYLGTIDPSIIPQPYVPPLSFDDMMNALRGVVDTPSLLAKQFGGRINNFIYECNALAASVNASASALNWPILDACERGKDSCYSLQASQLTKGRPIALYTVQKDATVAAVATQIPAPIGDILQLNPAYLGSPLITALSVVRYYRNAA